MEAIWYRINSRFNSFFFPLTEKENPLFKLFRPRLIWLALSLFIFAKVAFDERASPSIFGVWLIFFLFGQVAFNLGEALGKDLPSPSDQCFSCGNRLRPVSLDTLEDVPRLGRGLCEHCRTLKKFRHLTPKA